MSSTGFVATKKKVKSLRNSLANFLNFLQETRALVDNYKSFNRAIKSSISRFQKNSLFCPNELLRTQTCLSRILETNIYSLEFFILQTEEKTNWLQRFSKKIHLSLKNSPTENDFWLSTLGELGCIFKLNHNDSALESSSFFSGDFSQTIVNLFNTLESRLIKYFGDIQHQLVETTPSFQRNCTELDSDPKLQNDKQRSFNSPFRRNNSVLNQIGKQTSLDFKSPMKENLNDLFSNCKIVSSAVNSHAKSPFNYHDNSHAKVVPLSTKNEIIQKTAHSSDFLGSPNKFKADLLRNIEDCFDIDDYNIILKDFESFRPNTKIKEEGSTEHIANSKVEQVSTKTIMTKKQQMVQQSNDIRTQSIREQK